VIRLEYERRNIAPSKIIPSDVTLTETWH